MKYSLSLLLIVSCLYYHSSAQSVLNIASGIFSKKTVSNGLSLAATSTFQPITTLTTNIHIDKCCSVFVHYQITMHSTNKEFYSKLHINYANAGSIVHSGNQQFKTATGFYMANLNPGEYTFKVYYKSPVAINMPASWDWQTAILQVMWFEDGQVVSDGIKCSPTPTTTNSYNVWGPIRGTEAILKLPENTVILAAYQFSAEMKAINHVNAALDINGFHQHTSSLVKGNDQYLDLHGAWAENAYDGIYYFGIQYRSPGSFEFTDCKEKYKNNKNLYAMRLPPKCKVTVINPKNDFTFSSMSTWASTDLSYSLTLTEQSHVFIMFQYAGRSFNSYIAMRLSIDSVPQMHTVSLTGGSITVGNFGLWQGSLNKGNHKITIEYRSPVTTVSNVAPNLDWAQLYGYHLWYNRALTVIHC